jgi:hypothetical protein
MNCRLLEGTALQAAVRRNAATRNVNRGESLGSRRISKGGIPPRVLEGGGESRNQEKAAIEEIRVEEIHCQQGGQRRKEVWAPELELFA